MDVFERMDMFFRRVEMYTEVQLTIEMVDIFIQIIHRENPPRPISR